MQDQYGRIGLFADASDLPEIETDINSLVQAGVKTPRQARQLQRLMRKRDRILRKQGAREGAAIAASGYASGGYAGGLAGSGIRGMDVIEHEFGPEVIAQHNMQGAAEGLRQTSVAPPGSGRLVGIPFVVAGAVLPAHQITSGAGAVAAASTNLVTTAVSWAVLRIVALTTQTSTGTVGVVGVMQDLKIGGGPNLFLPEDWVLMDDYDTDKEQFAGLRAYPVLRSPNTAQVTCNAIGPAAGGAILFFALTLVTEVLRDDSFGPGLPGAYAR